MAKLSKEELLAKITERVTDEDLSIELMEDISDSFDVSYEEEKKAMEEKISELESKVEELKAKYKERFLKASEEKIEEKIEEPKEEEVIDIKEI